MLYFYYRKSDVMKKMMVLLIAFLMFVGVKVEALEVNKITVEGKEIELKDNVYEYDVALDVIYSQVSIVVDEKDDVSYRMKI